MAPLCSLDRPAWGVRVPDGALLLSWDAMVLLRCRAALLVLLVMAGTACGGKELGTETTGNNVRVAYAYNVQFHPAGNRPQRPVFSGETLDGKEISSKDVVGSVTVVNFWGSWCGECHREQPLFNEVYRRFEPKGVKFLGVNVRDPKADALSFVDQYGIRYPSIFDPFLRVTHRFGVYHFPTTYVLDRQGRVAAVVISAPASADELARVIDGVLA